MGDLKKEFSCKFSIADIRDYWRDACKVVPPKPPVVLTHEEILAALWPLAKNPTWFQEPGQVPEFVW